MGRGDPGWCRQHLLRRRLAAAPRHAAGHSARRPTAGCACRPPDGDRSRSQALRRQLASASASCGRTSWRLSPTTSSSEPESPAITGSPVAIASTIAKPNCSRQVARGALARTNMSLSLNWAGRSSCSTDPTRRIWTRSSCRSISSLLESGPVPTSVSSASTPRSASSRMAITRSSTPFSLTSRATLSTRSGPGRRSSLRGEKRSRSMPIGRTRCAPAARRRALGAARASSLTATQWSSSAATRRAPTGDKRIFGRS